MAIELLKLFRLSGTVNPVGTIVSRPPAEEADYVAKGDARYFGMSPAEMPAVFPSYGVGAQGLRTVLFGHSYADQEADVYSFDRPILNVQGTLNWANIFLNKALRIVFNGGVGGERINDWMLRFERDCVAHRPQIVILTDPINDLKNTTNQTADEYVRGVVYPNTDYQQDAQITHLPVVIARYQALIERVLSLGAVCVCFGASPPNPAETVNLGPRCVQFNNWLRRYASQTRNVLFAPVHLATVNPASTSGISLTGAYFDAIHPGADNGYKRGRILADVLRPLTPGYWDPLIYTVGDSMEPGKPPVSNMVVSQGYCAMTVNNGAGWGNEPKQGIVRVGDYATYNSQSQPDLNGTYYITEAPFGAGAVLRGYKVANLTRGMNGSDATAGQEVYTSLQMSDNPLITTTTGGTKSGAGSAQITGNVPVGMQVTNNSTSCSIALSTAAHTDKDGNATGYGNWLIMDVTSTADTTFFVSIFGSRGPSVPASAVYGRCSDEEVVQARADVHVVGASGGSGTPSGLYSVEWRITSDNVPESLGSSANGLIVADMYRPSARTEDYPNYVWRGVMETPEWKIPRGLCNSCDAVLFVSVKNGCSARIRIARISIEKVYHGSDAVLRRAGKIATQ